MSLRHEREGANLSVAGLVRNPPAAPIVERLTAVVFLFDQQGQFVTSAKAPIDFLKLTAGDESPFVVKVAAPQTVTRYRVSFRTEDGTRPHVDRRGDPPVTAPVALRGSSGSGSRFGFEVRVRFGGSRFEVRFGFEVLRLRREALAMRRHIRRPTAIVLALAALVGLQATTVVSGQEGFRFRSGVELINVTATVVDRTGRFLPGLTKDDFVIYEDNQPVEITHFSAERTPVSLGIVLDTSGSMQGQKWHAARDAIDRFLELLSDPADEFFLYRFSASPDLVQDWTNDRRALSWSLGRVNPNGGTAMYDGVAEAVPMAHAGRNRKKAIVIISDGNDTSSRVGVGEVRQMVRESEVLVYAVGIDGNGTPTIMSRPRPPVGGGPRFPIPFPIPGGGGRGGGSYPPFPGGVVAAATRQDPTTG